jgi:hypothetical protein
MIKPRISSHPSRVNQVGWGRVKKNIGERVYTLFCLQFCFVKGLSNEKMVLFKDAMQLYILLYN